MGTGPCGEDRSKAHFDPAANGRRSLTNTREVPRTQLHVPRTSRPQRLLPQSQLPANPDPGGSDNDDQTPRKRQRQMSPGLSTQRLVNSSPLVSGASDGSSSGDDLLPLVDERYWTKKGLILGRCVEMWDTFDQILDEGVARHPDIDGDPTHTGFANELYRKFLLFIEVAPAVIKVLQRGSRRDVGPELTAKLDKVINTGRMQARRMDVSGVRNAIGQWPDIEWKPAFPVARHLLGFKHDTSGKLLCPITLNWDDATVREGLRRGTQEVTAADYPMFLWPSGAMDIDDIYKGFLRGALVTFRLVICYPYCTGCNYGGKVY
ncbi:hypothetical protein H4582DRAFT_2071397 [Lactarius indigo]|nr:hypothetical protein H4582DRAFT_2071397 [Lactarius indigo]